MGLNRAILSIALVLFGAFSLSARGQDETQDAPLPGWIQSRLAELTPDDPEAYFLLGEEVAGEMRSRPEEELARDLFGLAYELSRSNRSPAWVAPSSCLALASIVRLESDERWLRALASRLDPRYAPPAWRSPEGDGRVSDTAFNAAEAVGQARAGFGVQARDLLDKPGVREILDRYGRLLGYSSGSGALWQIEQWAEEWPCRECGNERVVFRPDTDPPTYRECYTCRGNPGPRLDEEQLVNQLRFESRLLQGISRSWSAQLAIDYAAPLREPTAEELVSVLGIDAGKPYWRGGWVATPDGEPGDDAEPGATLDQPPAPPPSEGQSGG